MTINLFLDLVLNAFQIVRGINTRAGQQMLIRVEPAAATIPVDDMPGEMFVTMLSEQIVEIKDLGLKVFD